MVRASNFGSKKRRMEHRRKSSALLKTKTRGQISLEDKDPEANSGKDLEEDERKMLHRKFKWHSFRLWMTQCIAGLVMFCVAIASDSQLGITYFWSNRQTGARLTDLQYLWGICTPLVGAFGFFVYRQWAPSDWNKIDPKLAYQCTRAWLVMTSFLLLISTWGMVTLFVSFQGLKLGSGYPGNMKVFQIMDLIAFVGVGFYIFLRVLSLKIYSKKFKKWADWTGAWGTEGSKGINAVLPLERGFADLQKIAQSPQKKEMAKKEETKPEPPVPLDPSAYTVMSPQLYEQLWTDLPLLGQFDCKIAELVDPGALDAHLVARGFQVVASGAVRGRQKCYLAARRQESDAAGSEWFIAQLVANEDTKRLEASFKCQNSALVQDFVQGFQLNQIFQLVVT